MTNLNYFNLTKFNQLTYLFIKNFIDWFLIIFKSALWFLHFHFIHHEILHIGSKLYGINIDGNDRKNTNVLH